MLAMYFYVAVHAIICSSF